MPTNKNDLSDEELDSIIETLDMDAEDEIEDRGSELVVVRAAATKSPSRVRAVDTEAIPIDDETRRRMEKESGRVDDKLLRTMQGNVGDPHVLSTAAEELAEEIYALKFERERLETAGRDITNASGRRVTALKALIDTALKLKELTAEEPVDFNSTQMQVIMRLLFGKIRESLDTAGYKKNDIQAFFQVFQANMETFQVEAQRTIDQELHRS